MDTKNQEHNEAGLPPHEQDALVFRLAVRRLREERGWTQNQLATELRKLGLEEFSQVAVARLERGERAVKLGEARVIAAALNSTTWKMLEPEISLTKGVQDAYQEILAVRRVAEEMVKCTSRFESYKISFWRSLKEVINLMEAESNPGKSELTTIELILGKALDSVGTPDIVGKSYIHASSVDIATSSVMLFARDYNLSTEEYLEQFNESIDYLLKRVREYLSNHESALLPGSRQDKNAPKNES